MECSLKCSYPALVPRPQIWLILFSEFCLWMLRERQSRFSWCTYFSCPHPKITPTRNPDFTPVSQRKRRLVCGNLEISISSVTIPKFFELICRIGIHRTPSHCNIQKCAFEQVQIANEQFGRRETKHFCILQGLRVRLFHSLTKQNLHRQNFMLY